MMGTHRKRLIISSRENIPCISFPGLDVHLSDVRRNLPLQI
jgi:hypothetical protein